MYYKITSIITNKVFVYSLDELFKTIGFEVYKNKYPRDTQFLISYLFAEMDYQFYSNQFKIISSFNCIEDNIDFKFISHSVEQAILYEKLNNIKKTLTYAQSRIKFYVSIKEIIDYLNNNQYQVERIL